MMTGNDNDYRPDPGEESRPGRILVVDDEPSVLSALRRLLRHNGFEVFLADSGRAGLDLLTRESIDVVLSDMRMPEMNGAEFLEQVFTRWPETKRILLTGYSDVGATIAAINRGKIWRYIAKPWDDGDLVMTVQQALGHRYLIRENARLLKLTQEQNDALKSLNESLEARVEARTQELQQALKTLRQSFVNTINVFSGILELRGGLLAGHSRRVADHARRVARRMGLPDNEIQEIFLAGLLHDIGKLGLSDEAIEHPFNTLGPQQRGEVMKHPAKGETLLMPIHQLAGVAELVRCHHELFDGKGYPEGLSGFQIPLGARILSVVNDYDALQLGTLVPHPQRPPEALRYLFDNAGKRYDPSVVEAFGQVLAEQLRPDELSETPVRHSALQPGMRLTRDLMHQDGYLLLARDHVLNAQEIAQLARLAATEDHAITVYIAGTPPTGG